MRVSLAAGLCFVFLASLPACAPRSGKTHFDRWADQTAKRKEEEALQAKEKEWLRAMVSRGGAPVQQSPSSSNVSPADTPRASSGSQLPSNYSSLGSSGSRTSTGSKSRVIKPADQTPPVEEEEEAIY